MRRRYTAALVTLLVGMGAVSGCAQTPESSLVKQKGESAMKNYKSADDSIQEASGDSAETSDDLTDSSDSDASESAESAALSDEEGSTTGTGNTALRERLDAPETYTSEVTDDTSKLQIVTDAKVLLPDAEKLNTITVTQHTFDQTAIDAITEVFFPGGTIYDGTKYSAWTKAEIQEKLDEMNGYVAAGNLDPYDYGTDEDGNYYFDIYEAIENYEALLETAPEERILEEVTPQFGLSYTEGDSSYTDDNYFLGIVIMPDDSRYYYQFQRYSSMPMQIKIHRLESNETSYSDGIWEQYYSLKEDNVDMIGEQELKQEIGISLEEAKQTADELVQSLGITDMALAGWEYEVKFADDQSDSWVTTYRRENQEAAGYKLFYTRKIDGVPVTYTNSYGGASETESETETWCYERLEIIVSSRGIEDVEFDNQYDVGDVQTENVELLSFSDIIQTYEKMMLVQHADIINEEVNRTYCISRIELGYVRIYEPSADSRTGLLVPAWTFFGDFSGNSVDSDGQESSYELGTYLWDVPQICINAVDGSMIDLELGY